MDELEKFKPHKQLAQIMSLDSNASTQKNTPIVYSNVDVSVYKLERTNYEADNRFYLESGIQVNEPEVPFAKKLFGRVGYSGLRIIQSVKSSIGAHLGNNAIQCGSMTLSKGKNLR